MWFLVVEKLCSLKFEAPNYGQEAPDLRSKKLQVGPVDFKLVQLFTTNTFLVKEHKICNGKYKHYIDIFPLETQTGKTNIFYIHS
jgi:hypothetical protein